MTVHHILITVKHRHEIFGNLRCTAALDDDLFTTGDLGGLTEYQRAADLIKFIERIANGGIGATAGGGIGLTALGGYP